MKQKNANLPDIQKTRDTRGIMIDRVGIEQVHFPLLISKKDGGNVLVYSKIDLYGSLKHTVKGVNMSRFMEILMARRYQEISDDNLYDMLVELRDHLGEKDVQDVYVRIRFDYFLDKISPASKKKSVMSYPCTFIALLRSNRFSLQMVTEVLTTSNCPCSREISDFGAHGQRSRATVTVRPKRARHIWFEDLIPLIESQGSCEVYPLLKRTDEKYVTEKAYSNPKFVEDIVRDIATSLQDTNAIRSYKIKVSNEESIHQHDAVAFVARRLQGSQWRRDSKNLRS